MADKKNEYGLSLEYLEVLMKTYRTLMALCEKHKLTYFAAGGTMIGAIRHKGLIPWDDDIDVIMPREDYNKFLSLKDGLDGRDYYILDWKVKGYGLPFAKFCDGKSTLLPFKESTLAYGVYIDVFPLDYISGDNNTILKKCKKYRVLLHAYMSANNCVPYSILFNLFKEGKYTIAIGHFLGQTILKPFKPLLRKMIALYESRCFKGDKIVSTFGVYKEREIYDKTMFQDKQRVPFEDTIIYVPSRYDEYLKQMYKNYMQWPPEKNRVSNHDLYYQNLKRRVSISEIIEGTHDGEYIDRKLQENPYEKIKNY